MLIAMLGGVSCYIWTLQVEWIFLSIPMSSCWTLVTRTRSASRPRHLYFARSGVHSASHESAMLICVLEVQAKAYQVSPKAPTCTTASQRVSSHCLHVRLDKCICPQVLYQQMRSSPPGCEERCMASG